MSDNIEKLRDLKNKSGKPGRTQTDKLLEIASEAEFWHTDKDESYVTVAVKDHFESYPVESTPFRRWLRHQYFMHYGKPPGSTAMVETCSQCDSYASLEGALCESCIRVGEYNGDIYIDLADEDWNFVHVMPGSWEITRDVPIKFRRSPTMRPIPIPEPGGTVDMLSRFANIKDSDLPLLYAWLAAALRPSGPYPVLILQGPEGSAKSTLARLLKSLIDPSSLELRTIPREERDVFIGFKNSWAIAFDNISYVDRWLSDAFCRVATGGGFATRKLRTDDEELVIDTVNPIILTGIGAIGSNEDLLSRSVIIQLDPIDDENRLDESDLWKLWKPVRPKIFGLLMDAVAAGLANIGDVKIQKVPRMADFAKWGAASESVFWPAETFINAYLANQEDTRQQALESNPVASAIKKMMDGQSEWSGTASDLLLALEFDNPDAVRSKTWPKAAHILRRRVDQATGTLRSTGIHVTTKRTANQRLIYIIKDVESSILDENDTSYQNSQDVHSDYSDINDASDANLQGQTKNYDDADDADDDTIKAQNTENGEGVTLDDALEESSSPSQPTLGAGCVRYDANDDTPIYTNNKKVVNSVSRIGNRGEVSEASNGIKKTRKPASGAGYVDDANSVIPKIAGEIDVVAVLTKYVNKTVYTSSGPGTLQQITRDRATVYLRKKEQAGIKRVDFFPPDQVWVEDFLG